MRAEVDRPRPDLLLDASPRDPRAPRAELRGALRPRPAHRSCSRTTGSPSSAHAYGLDTAFAARGRRRPARPSPCCCEYDALPGIGHACGHNIIATAGLGAGLAAAALAEEVGGTVAHPRHAGRGGRRRQVLMAERGAFDGVDAAMMVHPAGADLAAMDAIAIQQLVATTTGKAAHAAAAPRDGPQRARRRRARLHERGRAAPAHPARRAHPRHLHRGAATSPTSCRRDAGDDWYVRSRDDRVAASRSRQRVLACLEAGADGGGLHDGASSGTTRPTPTWSTTSPMVDALRRQRSAGSAARGRSRDDRAARRRQHRHGQRQLPRAVDPPDDRGRRRRRADPHPGLRRVRPVAPRATGP